MNPTVRGNKVHSVLALDPDDDVYHPDSWSSSKALAFTAEGRSVKTWLEYALSGVASSSTEFVGGDDPRERLTCTIRNMSNDQVDMYWLTMGDAPTGGKDWLLYDDYCGTHNTGGFMEQATRRHGWTKVRVTDNDTLDDGTVPKVSATVSFASDGFTVDSARVDGQSVTSLNHEQVNRMLGVAILAMDQVDGWSQAQNCTSQHFSLCASGPQTPPVPATVIGIGFEPRQAHSITIRPDPLPLTIKTEVPVTAADMPRPDE